MKDRRTAFNCLGAPALTWLLLTLAVCSGCSSAPSPIVYRMGERAIAGPLVYTLVSVAAQTDRVGQPSQSLNDRDTVLLLVRITNTSPDDEHTIPPLALVDDQGLTYGEITTLDGPEWRNKRKLGPAQTEQGVMAFRVPVRHFRLSLSAPVGAQNVSIDLPASVVAAGFSTADNLKPATANFDGRRSVAADSLGIDASPSYANTLGGKGSLTDVEAKSIK